jgi:hypothetical protein
MILFIFTLHLRKFEFQRNFIFGNLDKKNSLAAFFEKNKNGRPCICLLRPRNHLRSGGQSLHSASRSGRWMLFWNVHLATDWLTQLEKKLHNLKPHAYS